MCDIFTDIRYTSSTYDHSISDHFKLQQFWTNDSYNQSLEFCLFQHMITIWTFGTQFVVMPSCNVLGSHDCHLQLPCQFSKKINREARGRESGRSPVYPCTPLCTLPKPPQTLNPSLTHSSTWNQSPQAKLHTHAYPLSSRNSPLTCLPACLLTTWDMQISVGFPTDFGCGSQWVLTRRPLPNDCYDSVNYGKWDSRDCHC